MKRKQHWTEKWMFYSAIWGLCAVANTAVWIYTGALNPLLTMGISLMTYTFLELFYTMRGKI